MWAGLQPLTSHILASLSSKEFQTGPCSTWSGFLSFQNFRKAKTGPTHILRLGMALSAQTTWVLKKNYNDNYQAFCQIMIKGLGFTENWSMFEGYSGLLVQDGIDRRVFHPFFAALPIACLLIGSTVQITAAYKPGQRDHSNVRPLQSSHMNLILAIIYAQPFCVCAQ